MGLRIVRSIAAALVAVTLVVQGPATAAPGGRTGGSETTPCGSGVITHSPTRLWPPNHKFHTVVISFFEPDEATHDGDDLTVLVTAILHDQADPDGSNEMNGSGKPNAGLDWNGIGNRATEKDDEEDGGAAVTTAGIRAERSGRVEAGRTYTISVTCTNNGGTDGSDDSTELVTLEVHVPHSMGA